MRRRKSSSFLAFAARLRALACSCSRFWAQMPAPTPVPSNARTARTRVRRRRRAARECKASTSTSPVETILRFRERASARFCSAHDADHEHQNAALVFLPRHDEGLTELGLDLEQRQKIFSVRLIDAGRKQHALFRQRLEQVRLKYAAVR